MVALVQETCKNRCCVPFWTCQLMMETYEIFQILIFIPNYKDCQIHFKMFWMNSLKDIQCVLLQLFFIGLLIKIRYLKISIIQHCCITSYLEEIRSAQKGMSTLGVSIVLFFQVPNFLLFYRDLNHSNGHMVTFFFFSWFIFADKVALDSTNYFNNNNNSNNDNNSSNLVIQSLLLLKAEFHVVFVLVFFQIYMTNSGKRLRLRCLKS